MRQPAGSPDGFLPIEALMALALLSLVLPPSYDLLRNAGRRGARDAERGRAQSDLRLAQDIVGRDLRSAYLTAEEGDSFFVARADQGFARLEFTRAGGRTDLQVAGITFDVTTNPVSGQRELWRRTNGSGRSTFLIGNVRTFTARLFDGENWVETWGWDAARNTRTLGIRGLPLVVEVRLEINGSAGPVESIERVPVMMALLNRQLHE